MMRRTTIGLVGIAILTVSLCVGCSTEKSDFATATILHGIGFDFSQDKACNDSFDETCDGDALNFDISQNSFPTDGNFHFWFRNSAMMRGGEGNNRVKDLGTKPLDQMDASDIPSTWPTQSPELLVDHTYIIATVDPGYAVFTVNELVESNGDDYGVKVEYIYSSDGSFGN